MEKIKSGVFATLTPDAVITAIRDELGIETTDQNISFRRLVNEAIRHFDCLSIFKKQQCCLEVDCGMAILPNGLYRLLALAVGEGCPTYNSIYVDVPFLQACGCDTNKTGVWTSGNAYEIQDGKVVFHSNYSGITEVQIAYLGMNVDDDGLMKIYTDMERGVVAYVAWKYTRRNFKIYPQYIQQEYKKEWIAQKKFIKSIDFANDAFYNRREILEWMNALLCDKTFLP